MRIGTAFPSKFLKASDLNGKSVTVTIMGCRLEAIGMDKQQRPILTFHGVKKSLVLNQVNSRHIASLLGSEETDEWIGKKISLVPAQTEYRGDLVPCIRVAAAKAAAAKATKPAKPAKPVEPEPDDDLPEGLGETADEQDVFEVSDDDIPF